MPVTGGGIWNFISSGISALLPDSRALPEPRKKRVWPSRVYLSKFPAEGSPTIDRSHTIGVAERVNGTRHEGIVSASIKSFASLSDRSHSKTEEFRTRAQNASKVVQGFCTN